MVYTHSSTVSPSIQVGEYFLNKVVENHKIHMLLFIQYLHKAQEFNAIPKGSFILFTDRNIITCRIMVIRGVHSVAHRHEE
jgi:hypothetical protein